MIDVSVKVAQNLTNGGEGGTAQLSLKLNQNLSVTTDAKYQNIRLVDNYIRACF